MVLAKHRNKKTIVKNVHLVLESSPGSERFLMKFIQKTNDAILLVNKQIQDKDQQFEIKQITGSNCNALAMFLVATNLPKEFVTKQIEKINTSELT